MRKKLLMLVITIIAVAAIGCGSGSGKENSTSQSGSESKTESQTAASDEKAKTEEAGPETVKAPDLTGLWIQEEPGEKSFMAADIREDGKIGVFFVGKEDNTVQTYWVGTYIAPTDNTEEYSWTSENTFGGMSLLASGDDEKEFTYKEGKISYPFTIRGVSGTVSLIRGDWDTSNIPDDAFGSVKASQSDFKNIEIKESGWVMKYEKYLTYYVILHNPNENVAVELPAFRITARNADGALLATADQTLSVIYPGQDFVYGFQAFSIDEVPAAVDFEMLDAKDYNLKEISIMPEYRQLEVVNSSAGSDKLLGEINNPNDYDIDTAVAVAICKNSAGDLVAVESTFVKDIKAGTTTPFSISVMSDESIDNVEFYANQWT